MRMKSLILIFIALGCGLVASIGISQVMERGGGAAAPAMEMEQILVALADIDIDAKLSAENVQLEEWPKSKVPEGSVRSLDEIEAKFAQQRFFKGEPILLAKISDQNVNPMIRIPEGYRVMPVKVDDDTVLKAISPGDRVDVMVFLRRSEEIKQTATYTILRNVRVFAVNSNTERDLETKGQEVNARTVSLIIKPQQSQQLAVASQIGKIILTMRRPDETDDESEGEDVTDIGEILAGKASLGSEPTAPAAGPAPPVAAPSGIGNFLDTVAMPTPIATPAAPAPKGPSFTMHIFGPADVKAYEWQDKNALPVETPLHGGNVDPAAAAPVAAPQLAPATEPTAAEPTITEEPAVEPTAEEPVTSDEPQPDYGTPAD